MRSRGIRALLAAALAASSALALTASAMALAPSSVSQPQDIQTGPDSSDPLVQGSAELNGVLIFGADDGTFLADHPEGHGGELWRSDGTPGGTYMLKDIYEGGYIEFANSSQPSEFTTSGGEVFFDAFSPSNDGLWKTDGTAAGTVAVISLNNSALRELVDVNGILYFLANSDGANGFELWKSDGTTAGTEMVKDIEAFWPTVADREAHDFIAVGNRLFFSFETAADGRELWTSDGTALGTKQVKNIDGGPGDSIAVNWEAVEFDGKLFFPATDGFNDRQLWSSDGTAAGTEPLAVTSASPAISLCCGTSFAARGAELFFESDFGLARYEIGGSSGLVSGGNVANEPTNVGGTIYFYKSSPSALWRYDSGAATKVADVDLPALLTEFDGGLYFQASDAAHGTELWRSDGSAAGTERITDINPGAGDSLVNALVVAGDNLFFRGEDDGTTGIELWEAHTDTTPPDTTITTGPASGSTIASSTATFAFSSSEAGSTFTCALDGGAPEACNAGTKTYDDLADGDHSFAVFATDGAGNADLSAATRSFRVEVPPAETPTEPSGPTTPTLDRKAPRLALAGATKQKSKSKVVVKASCDEACDLKATGTIKVKVLKGNKVKKTKTLKLKAAKASAQAGESAKLKLKLNGKAKKLVKKVLKKKASKATVTVAATDAAGNSSSAERTIKVVKKKKG